MANPSRTGMILVLSGMVGLAGCVEGTNSPFATRSSATADAPVSGGEAAGTIVEKDVEAPDVFAVNESGLWDGRPSLGGVWVAHPDVADPERVIIRNEANGQYVIGALFRRERDNPGPRIQVSSDAAAELGMLAGQPSVLDVVALRREEIEIPQEPVAEEAPIAPMAIATETTLEAEQPAEMADAAATDATANPELADAELVAPAAEPKKKGLFAGLFGGKKAAQPMEPVGSVVEDSAIETASLDPIAAASAAIDAAEASEAASSAPAALAPVAPAAPAAAAPATQTASVKQPFIQIGIFSVEENAQNTATSLRSAGLVPIVREQEARGKQFWRVIVGPASSTAERRQILAKVRDLGFADAYYVTN